MALERDGEAISLEGIIRADCGTLEALYDAPRHAVRPALLAGGNAFIIGCNFARGSCEPRQADLAGAKKLREAFARCGLELGDVYLFGEDGFCGLEKRGAFREASTKRNRPRYRRGKHEAPEHALEGFFGEEIAAIYDVLNRSTIAQAEPLLRAAEALNRLGPVVEVEEDLPESEKEKAEQLALYLEEASEDEVQELIADYAEEAAYRFALLRVLCSRHIPEDED